jgi:uncharacterized protein with gpF-like domain
LESDTLSEISRIMMGGFRSGKRWETISQEILSETDLEPGVFNKAETRADLIARDQTSKLYGNLAQKRQENSGLIWYYWRTMEDERVVGTPGGRYPKGSDGHGNHFKMDGKVCRWDNPNLYAKSVQDAKDGNWEMRTEEMPSGHPGDEYQCRCYAEPIFDTIFE